MKRKHVFIAVAILLVTPLLASAAGLVPCGGPSEPTCNTCHVAELLNNVLAWLVGILSIVFTIIFVVSGIRLVISAGSVSEKEAAKKMIMNAFIGFVIVLAGWLLVDLGMKALLTGGAGEINSPAPGPWNTIQCSTQTPTQIVPASAGLANGGTISQACVNTGPSGYDCSAASAACTAGGGTPAINAAGDAVDCTYAASAYSGSCNDITDTGNPCHASNPDMINAFGPRVNEAAVICNKESGGAPVRSGSDLCCGPSGNCSGAPSFSGGYFQVNVLAHASDLAAAGASGCSPGFFAANGSDTLQGDCVRRNSNNICTGWSCSITNTAAYNSCMQAALDPTYNFAVSGDLFDSRGFNPWANSADLCGVPQ